MGALTTSSVGDAFFFYFPRMCFRLAQGCRKGGPNTKWFGEKKKTRIRNYNANEFKCHFLWVAKMQLRSFPTNLDTCNSMRPSRAAEMPQNSLTANCFG